MAEQQLQAEQCMNFHLIISRNEAYSAGDALHYEMLAKL
jgi:hypothetical protein